MATLKVTNIKNESFAGDQLYLKTDGKIGIGTTDPDAPLTIHNSADPEIRFGYNASQDHRIAWDSSKVFIHADPDNANGSSALSLSVDGTSRLYINDSGNIGIGTTSPVHKLVISQTNSGGIAAIHLPVDESTILGPYANTHVKMGGNVVLGANGQIDLATSGVSKVTIRNDGKVGIGTTNPLFPSGGGLEIYNSSVPRLKLTNSSSGTAAGDGSQIYLSASDLCIDHKENGNIKFYTAGVEKMRLTSGGLLLHGSTTSDLSGNHSFISVGARHGFQYEGSAGTYLSLILGSANGSVTIDANARSGNYPALLFNVGGSEKVRFATNGSVGIGTDTSASSAKFQVSESDSTECYMQVTNQTTGYDGNSGLLVGINNSEVAKIMQMENLGLDIGTNGNNRISIANDGHCVFSNSIALDGETAAANRLDDYEEGTWTPGITFGGGTTGLSIHKQTGYYVKIGRLVNLGGTLILSAKGSSTGSAALTGLPFNVGNLDVSTSAEGGGFFTYWINMNSDKLDWTLRGSNNSSTADISVSRSGGHTQIDAATEGDFQNSSSIRFVMTYQT